MMIKKMIDNGDSQKEHDVDFSNLINSPDSDYKIRVYKVVEASTCSSEFEFNLTIDNDIQGDNKEITLEIRPIMPYMMNRTGYTAVTGTGYRGGIGTGYGGLGDRTGTGGSIYTYGNYSRLENGIQNMGLKANCLLSSKNKNHITCQVERETLQLNLTLYEYFSFDSDQLIMISTENQFPFYCIEELPIAALTFVSAIKKIQLECNDSFF